MQQYIQQLESAIHAETGERLSNVADAAETILSNLRADVQAHPERSKEARTLGRTLSHRINEFFFSGEFDGAGFSFADERFARAVNAGNALLRLSTQKATEVS